MAKKKIKAQEKEQEPIKASPDLPVDTDQQDATPKDSRSAKENEDSDPQNADPVKALQAEVANLNDKYLRLYSEFDNYRKRTVRERADLLKTASSGLITQLLPVMDDFERAAASFSTTTDIEVLKEGIMLIFNKFKKTLEQKGLEAIKSTGEPFDTDLHEAITNIPASSDDMKGKVAEEIEKGYMLNGTVIRFAKVAVAN